MTNKYQGCVEKNLFWGSLFGHGDIYQKAPQTNWGPFLKSEKMPAIWNIRQKYKGNGQKIRHNFLLAITLYGMQLSIKFFGRWSTFRPIHPYSAVSLHFTQQFSYSPTLYPGPVIWHPRTSITSSFDQYYVIRGTVLCRSGNSIMSSIDPY